METPRRVTRSGQMSSLGPSSAVKPPGCPASGTKKKETPARAPFTDLTNDSPITGLMPAKMAANVGCVYESTPRSKIRPFGRPIGEDLMRMQVTALLKKVEAEAAMMGKHVSCAPDLFESPMRLAAPTPANTPVTAPLEGEAKRAGLAPIKIGSPICQLEVVLNMERKQLTSVSSPVLLTSVEASSDQHQVTTRTLQFDSPHRKDANVNAEPHTEACPVEKKLPTPTSVTVAEILSTIEKSSFNQINNQTASRTLDFESPEKAREQEDCSISRKVRFESPQHELIGHKFGASVLVTPGPHCCHPGHDAEDDDSWSVIVNVNSPGKMEGEEDLPFGDHTESEISVEPIDFLDDKVSGKFPAKSGAMWERRDGFSIEREFKDEAEYENYEDAEEEYEVYENETEGALDNDACEELCEGISHIVIDKSKGLPPFRGKHIRFTYNSDDDIETTVVTDNTFGPCVPDQTNN